MIRWMIVALLLVYGVADAGMSAPRRGCTGGTADYCSGKLGSYSSYADADHPDGTTTQCITGGTSTVTLATGVTADSGSNSTSGGTYGYLWDGTTNSYLDIGSLGITTQNGRVSFDFKTPATIPAQNVGLGEYFTDATHKVTVYLQHSAGTYRISVIHADGSNTTATSAYQSLSGSTWYTATADWNSTAGNVRACLDADCGNTAGTLDSFTTPTNGFRLGEDQNGITGGDVGWAFDDIYMGASQQ